MMPETRYSIFMCRKTRFINKNQSFIKQKLKIDPEEDSFAEDLK